MGTERMSRKVAACHCGKGAVIAHFWSNNHAFASDYSWHVSEFELQCDDCAREWEIALSVSDPATAPPGKNVAYFVERDEAHAVSKHNDDIGQKAYRLGEEMRRLQDSLDTTIQSLQNTLVSRAECAGSGLEAKFDAIGKILGFPDLSTFRAKVVRTRPSTYVAQLVTRQSCIGVLSRLGRDGEGSGVTATITKLDDLKRTRDLLEASKCLPRAVGHFLYDF